MKTENPNATETHNDEYLNYLLSLAVECYHPGFSSVLP